MISGTVVRVFLYCCQKVLIDQVYRSCSLINKSVDWTRQTLPYSSCLKKNKNWLISRKILHICVTIMCRHNLSTRVYAKFDLLFYTDTKPGQETMVRLIVPRQMFKRRKIVVKISLTRVANDNHILSPKNLPGLFHRKGRHSSSIFRAKYTRRAWKRFLSCGPISSPSNMSNTVGPRAHCFFLHKDV